jgi:hypothetical protein
MARLQRKYSIRRSQGKPLNDACVTGRRAVKFLTSRRSLPRKAAPIDLFEANSLTLHFETPKPGTPEEEQKLGRDF